MGYSAELLVFGVQTNNRPPAFGPAVFFFWPHRLLVSRKRGDRRQSRFLYVRERRAADEANRVHDERGPAGNSRRVIAPLNGARVGIVRGDSYASSGGLSILQRPGRVYRAIAPWASSPTPTSPGAESGTSLGQKSTRRLNAGSRSQSQDWRPSLCVPYLASQACICFSTNCGPFRASIRRANASTASRCA